jgi:hypothetical protein
MSIETDSLENARDRGAADSYYGRRPSPHVRKGAVEIPVPKESREWKAYWEGYETNEQMQNFKDWGPAQ